MIRALSIAATLSLTLALGACGGSSMSVPGSPGQTANVPDQGSRAAARPVDPNSLYARLGGRDAIAAVMDDFVNRMAKDRRIGKRFAKTDAPALKAKLTDQLCEASGGPCKYAGKDMKAAHTGMKITNAEWNATGNHMIAAMRAKGVKPKEQQEVMAALGGMKGDIVGH
jgi:hemoglobin